MLFEICLLISLLLGLPGLFLFYRYSLNFEALASPIDTYDIQAVALVKRRNIRSQIALALLLFAFAFLLLYLELYMKLAA